MEAGAKGCALAVVAGVVGLLLAMVMLVTVVAQSQAACTSATSSASGGTDSQPPASKYASNVIPANYLALYQKAGSDYGLNWTILAGIGRMESRHGLDNGPGIHSGQNPAGAKGPMQFLQPTWDSYGVDGNGDGVKDVYDPADAIPGAANYLKHSGAPGNWRKAIFAYNHADWYVSGVLGWAAKYAAGAFSISPANTAGTQTCTPTGGKYSGQLPAGTPDQVRRAIAFAESKLGTPYLWGGTGPRYDCSGLTQAAWKAAGISIPRTAAEQYRWAAKVPFGQERAGDLVFFEMRSDGVHHVGMVVDPTTHTMIESPHTGDVVKYANYAKHSQFVGFGRVYQG